MHATVEQDNQAVVDLVIPIEVFRIVSGETVLFVFKARADATRDDALFVSSDLSANDVVVLTEV